MARKSFEILAVATVAALFAVAVLAEDRIPRAIQGIDAPKVEKAEAESVRGYLIKDSEGRLQKCSREDFQRVEREARLSRYGGDCYAYCALAAGHVDLVVETNLQPYDIVALIPIIEGAGGVVTTWSGGPAAQGGAIVAAGDPALHEEALKLLGG